MELDSQFALECCWNVAAQIKDWLNEESHRLDKADWDKLEVLVGLELEVLELESPELEKLDQFDSNFARQINYFHSKATSHC